MQGKAGSLRWEISRSDEQVELVLGGELDLVASQALRDVLDDLTGVFRVVIDLADVSYVDSTGLHSLLNLRTRIQASGAEFVIRAPSPFVQRAIEVSGLKGMFEVTA